MFKLILISVILSAGFLYSQEKTSMVLETELPKSAELLSLIDKISLSPVNPALELNLIDYKKKAQSGLDFMIPGCTIENVRCEMLSDWSATLYESFYDYLLDLYSKDMVDLGSEGFISEFQKFNRSDIKFGIMSWDIKKGFNSKSVKSVAVFNSDGNVIYDSELVYFITGTTEGNQFSEDGGNLNAPNAIINQKTGSVEYTYTVSGTFGSVQHYNKVSARAFAPPYVTAATNDAFANAQTTGIISKRQNSSGAPPPTTPFVYFGKDGVYANTYANATPFKNRFYLTSPSGDQFNTGVYSVVGDNGDNLTFSFDFSVSAGPVGLGITPHVNNTNITLSSSNASEVNFNNYFYYYLLGNTYRLIFYEGGSLSLSNFNLLTSNTQGEVGNLNYNLVMQCGYWSYLVVYYWTNLNRNLDINNVQYVRGDHLRQPAFLLTSTRYNIPVGQIDTLKLRATNRSGYVTLKGGSVSMNTSSLNNKLTLLSAGTVSIDSITPNGFKEYKFVVRGNENGIVTPQANISNLKWGYPVPPDVVINNVVSINSNIDVSPLIKTLTMKMPVQGFYDANTDLMIPDTARVYLRNSTAPFTLVDSSKAVLNSNGSADFAFTKAVNYASYYIVTKHRNSIETWSSTAKQFTNSALVYDFSTSASKAFGNNLIQVNGSPLRFAVYGGDINKDGNVNTSDVLAIYNDVTSFAAGYVNTDITGDNNVNITDLLMAYNNAGNFVSKIVP